MTHLEVYNKINQLPVKLLNEPNRLDICQPDIVIYECKVYRDKSVDQL